MLGQSELTVLVDPRVQSKITQGITTELTGEGGSVAPQTSFTIEDLLPGIAEYKLTVDWRDYDGYFRRLKARGSAINFAHLVGATQVRQAVLKSDNRLPEPAELEAMKRHVARAMEAGAFGLSSSLIYPPAKGKGRPRILRKLTRMDPTQQELFELFGLEAFAPREGTTAKWRGF